VIIMSDKLEQLAACVGAGALNAIRSCNDDGSLARVVQIVVKSRVAWAHEPIGQDTWLTPVVTWGCANGDCEDIAILKLSLLRLAGVPSDGLSLVYGKRHGEAHVLAHFGGLALDVDYVGPAGEHDVQVLAYTSGTEPVFEDGSVMSDKAIATWRSKVAALEGWL
jgi:hypothetical protein